MATGQCDKRHAMAQPIGELIVPGSVRRAEKSGWQLRRWAAVVEAAYNFLTAAF